MRTTTLALCLVIILSALCGCTAQEVNVKKADGTEITVTLRSLFKDESAENFSYGRDADSVMLDIGALNSDTDFEDMAKFFEFGKRIGAGAAGVPIP